jgi:hypothetical protein
MRARSEPVRAFSTKEARSQSSIAPISGTASRRMPQNCGTDCGVRLRKLELVDRLDPAAIAVAKLIVIAARKGVALQSLRPD